MSIQIVQYACGAWHGERLLLSSLYWRIRGSTLPDFGNYLHSLVEFGFPRCDLDIETLTTYGNIITFGIEPVRVDFISKISGVLFQDAWENRVRGTYGNVAENFIGRIDLIKNKHSTGRPKDQIDAEELSA